MSSGAERSGDTGLARVSSRSLAAAARPAARDARAPPRARQSNDSPPCLTIPPIARRARPRASRGRAQGRLFRKYLLLILTLVTRRAARVGRRSASTSRTRSRRPRSASLQHEKAIAAASRIEQYIRADRAAARLRGAAAARRERRRAAPHRVPEAPAAGAGSHRHRAARRRRPRAGRCRRGSAWT